MKRLTLALMTAAACMCMPLSLQAAGTLPPMFDWTGPYAGIQFGYGFGHTFQANTTGKSTNGTLDGVIVGGTAGYNKMMSSNVVLGIVGDFAFSNINGTSKSTRTFACPNNNCFTEVNWFGTARARLGYAMGNTMLYATGGLAAAGLDAGAGPFTPGRDTNVGWTAGGGIEHAFSSSVTGRIEYLYTDLGRLNIGAPCTIKCYTNVKFNLVRAGVDFHF